MLCRFRAEVIAKDTFLERCPKGSRCASSSQLPWWLHVTPTLPGIAQQQFPQASRLPWALAGMFWKTRQLSRPWMSSSLSLATSPPRVDYGCPSLVGASLSLLHHQGWRPCTLPLRRRMFAPCQCALTLVANGLAHFRRLSTRCKNTPYTTSRSKDHGPSTGSCLRLPGASWGQWHGTTGGDKQWGYHHRVLESTNTSSYANCLGTARSMTNSIFRIWLLVKWYHGDFNCGRNSMLKSCARPRLAVFRRVMPRNDISSRTGKWVASQLAEEPAILKERRKGREERELVAAASDPSGRNHRKPESRGCLEAVAVRGSFVTTSIESPFLLPLPTGVGFLPRARQGESVAAVCRGCN